MNKSLAFVMAAFLLLNTATAQVQQVAYPYPSHQFRFEAEENESYLSYMDVAPAAGNGKTILLLHGKNFNGYYWKDLIPALVKKGYRVLVPDQPGWGKSGKPDLHYSFHLLSMINKRLLDSLHVSSVTILGHSMGGMLAIRFSLMYPSMVEKLVLENPIGLEDYKTFVPYQTMDELYKKEKSATYESYKKYQASYYPSWKPAYEQYVAAQAAALADTGFNHIAFINAVTYQMIYEQPVVYELNRLTVPTLFIIGQADRTVVGKDQLPADKKDVYGQYPQLGKKAAAAVPSARIIEMEGVGHIPHVQELEDFKTALFTFL
ncbi:MAG TPA: alpha/beta hydrolase [Chitinophagaceae bacterium]|nr:alpha/beta hydrolase [Chitinophagaceae bacterium]